MAQKLTVVLDAEVERFKADILASEKRIVELQQAIIKLRGEKAVGEKTTAEISKLNKEIRGTNVLLAQERLNIRNTRNEWKAYSASQVQVANTTDKVTTSLKKGGAAHHQFRNQAGADLPHRPRTPL